MIPVSFASVDRFEAFGSSMSGAVPRTRAKNAFRFSLFTVTLLGLAFVVRALAAAVSTATTWAFAASSLPSSSVPSSFPPSRAVATLPTSAPSTLAKSSMPSPPLKPISCPKMPIGSRIIDMITWHAVSAHPTCGSAEMWTQGAHN